MRRLRKSSQRASEWHAQLVYGPLWRLCSRQDDSFFLWLGSHTFSIWLLFYRVFARRLGELTLCPRKGRRGLRGLAPRGILIWASFISGMRCRRLPPFYGRPVACRLPCVAEGKVTQYLYGFFLRRSVDIVDREVVSLSFIIMFSYFFFVCSGAN